jgi:hypothetical protein
MVVGGAIGLHLTVLLLPGDDDVAGVPDSRSALMIVRRSLVEES